MKKKLNDIYLQRDDKRTVAELWSGQSQNGIVVSAHYRASEAGATILQAGGNAFDAAVAVSAALGVVEPAASGLGGMTIMTIHLKAQNRIFIVEGPCRAPVNATPTGVAISPRKSGYTAVAVPTNPAVLAYILKKYGTLSANHVLQPAIQLAEEGYLMTPFQHRVLNAYAGQLNKHNGDHFFLNHQNQPFMVGDCVTQPILASTLKRLARYGFEEFYLGETGDLILKDMKKNGGFLSQADFDPVPYPIEAEPLSQNVLDWQVHTTPPPGGGFAVLQMLMLFDKLAPKNFDPDSPEAAILFASIIHKVRKDRIKYRLELAKDTKGMTDMLGDINIERLAAAVQHDFPGSGETTHFNVIDRWGNIVACTQSIERSYGAKVVTPGAGFLYNGFMKGFKIENKRHPHYLRPGAVARSNAAPTIILASDKMYAIGSTGSERMASGLFQTLIRLDQQCAFDAVAAPRLHCTPDKQISYEPERFSHNSITALARAGYQCAPFAEAWAFSAGGLQLAYRHDSRQWAVADPRRDGAVFSSSID